jgi:hypothetical protein
MDQVLRPAARWDEALELRYASFVASIAEGVRAERCHRLDQCLRDPSVNPLHEPDDDEIALGADCADLPHALRAYFALKHALPFALVSQLGRDRHGEPFPSAVAQAADFPTPLALLQALPGIAHTSLLRLPPWSEDSDFYPVAPGRASIRPGTVFFDPGGAGNGQGGPGGHVLVVARVDPDGSIDLFDAHPDHALTYRRFGPSLRPGRRGEGGGFLRHRPLACDRDGRSCTRARNRDLPDYDPSSQFEPAAWARDGAPPSYHAFIRARLATSPPDPIADLRAQVRALCRDLQARRAAVLRAAEAGLPQAPHPPALPQDPFATDGPWEIYATPGRDLRLRTDANEVVALLAQLDRSGPAGQAAWQEEAAAPGCTVRYTGSTGRTFALSLPEVLRRLPDLSFDPYHCPELRWGAPPHTPERAGCPADPVKERFYDEERPLRKAHGSTETRGADLRADPNRATVLP